MVQHARHLGIADAVAEGVVTVRVKVVPRHAMVGGVLQVDWRVGQVGRFSAADVDDKLQLVAIRDEDFSRDQL
jgi:hypothetical protein